MIYAALKELRAGRRFGITSFAGCAVSRPFPIFDSAKASGENAIFPNIAIARTKDQLRGRALRGIRIRSLPHPSKNGIVGKGQRNRNSGQRAGSRSCTRVRAFYPIRPGLTCSAIRGAILRFRLAGMWQVSLLQKGIGLS